MKIRLIIIIVLFAIALALAFTQPKQKPATLKLGDIKTEVQVQYVIPMVASAGPIFARQVDTYALRETHTGCCYASKVRTPGEEKALKNAAAQFK